MNSKLFLWECIGAIAIFFIGSFLHFGYELTNKMSLFTCFFAVNESIWEHTKLTFWAPLIFALIEYFYVGKFYPNFLVAKTAGAIITTIAMLLLYYTYIGVTGKHSLAADLIIYEIAIIIGLLISYKLLILPELPKCLSKISILVLIFGLLIYYLFSYSPPKFPLFKCSVTGNYGIGKNSSI